MQNIVILAGNIGQKPEVLTPIAADHLRAPLLAIRAPARSELRARAVTAIPRASFWTRGTHD